MVPLMIPLIEVISFAAMSRASTPMIGTPAATADSNRSAAPEARESASSRAPNVASSNLFAVTTGRPAFSAVSTTESAGSNPPISSTTRSTSDAARAAASVLSGAIFPRPAASAFATSRTAMPAISIPHSSYRETRPRATAAPTVPPPRRAIVKPDPDRSLLMRQA